MILTLVGSSLLTFTLIFFIGYLGYRILSFLHMPGGAVTGSLVMIALPTSQGIEWATLPSYTNTIFQVIIGTTIGCRFSKKEITTMKSILAPGLLSSLEMIFFSLLMGVLLAKMTGIELGTALYASVPGGLAEMGLIALAFNLNVVIVTLFQFIRVISINLSVPFIVSQYHHRRQKGVDGEGETVVSQETTKEGEDKAKDKRTIGKILATLLAGGIGGFTAKYVGLPVGGLLGSMLVVGILRTSGIPLKELPKWLVIFAQVSLGGCLGTSFTPAMVTTFKTLLFPVLFFSVLIVLNGLAIGFLFYRILGWDLTTSLLATATGGATLMTITALELNADAVKVSLLQAIRLVIILLVMPNLIPHLL